MFNKLPNEARKLLEELLKEDNPVSFLDEKFTSENSREVELLKGILANLVEDDLIEIFWENNKPLYILITKKGRTYFEREEKHLEEIGLEDLRTFDIGCFAAKYSMEYSIGQIAEDIETQGDQDKEALRELLEDAQELIESMISSGKLPINKGFYSKLESHREKHEWFYGEIVGLFGSTVINLLQR